MFLGIESSCDESAVALYQPETGYKAQLIHSQIAQHQRYGGVVPEIAARDHVRNLPALCKQLLDEQGLKLSDLDAVAYTAGPGLIGALLVGASYGHALAYAIDKPAYPVNHLEGHLLVARLDCPDLHLPYLALIASGGHTCLYLVREIGDYQLVGDSLDDACGEAIDKTARLLGLAYPGGAELEQLASQGQANRYKFSRPLARQKAFNFSFSGLKTQARYLIDELRASQDEQWRADLACSFQQTVINTLLDTTVAAAQAHDCQRITICGGVSANKQLRQQAQRVAEANGLKIYFPDIQLSTDNALMIAYAGAQRAQAGLPPANDLVIKANPRLTMR